MVLWEELGDSIRIDKGDILCDYDAWSSLSDLTKAAASAAAEAIAASEANAAIRSKAALKAEAEAKFDAATENLRQQFVSIQGSIESTAKELHCLRLRASAALCHVEASDPSLHSCSTVRGDSNCVDQVDAVLLQTPGPATILEGDLGTVPDLTANNELPQAASFPLHGGPKLRRKGARF
jgi:hypothetical protein